MTKGMFSTTIVLALSGICAAAEQDQRVFEMRTYYASAGRLDDLHARFRNHTVKLFEKHGMTNIGYFVPVENPDNKLIYFLAYPSLEAKAQSWKAFMADPDWLAVRKQTEANGEILAKIESLTLGATDYSPSIRPVAQAERVFELRTYTASPGNLGHLNARFRNHTVKLFEKHGINSIGYWCPLKDQLGADNTLVYIVAHKSLDAAKASFGAFRQDPAWIAAKTASEDAAGGSLTAQDGVKSLFLKATDYSPMK